MSGSATYTFLFTDIEGSTRLWEADREAMTAALERHDAILAGAFGSGDVFKHTGDGMAAAFSSPGDALQAAITAQRALAAEPWPTERPVKVRMGISSGDAQHRDDDYFGTPLNRTARLMDAAHGGQIVLSDLSRSLLGTLPAGIELEDLGEHRLKDLGEPVRVYQVVAEGLERNHPPLRSLAAYRTNLPVFLTSFVGRTTELATTLEMLADSRLVTLTGVGGVGKTRLAVQTAAESLDRFADGVWLVELGPLSEPSLVVREVADAIGVTEEATRPVLDVVLDHLRDREMLIVLDNCEHLIDETAKLAETMLRSSPGLKLIATSREGLDIGGERLWRVPSMTRGSDSADAVALFSERAALIRPGFALDDETRPFVEKICTRLDGIPLAIELATARLKVFTPQQVAERLDDRFRLLTGGSRTALPRQRTLQATMDWSYDLLTEHQRTLLRRLSVFYGGFDFEAAEEVCSDDPLATFEILDLLSALIESSLVIVEEAAVGSRYALLETVRQYALDRLVESGEADAVRRRHANHFASLTDTIDRALMADIAVADRVEADHDNVRAALTWCLEASEGTLAIRLACGMGRFWFYRAYIREGLDWLHRILREVPAEDTANFSEMTSWAGTFEIHAGNLIEGQRLVESAHEIAVAIGDRALVGRSENALGNVELTRGDLAKAREHYERCLEMAEPSYRSVVLVNLGMVYAWMGDVDKARAASAEIARSGDNRAWAATVDAWIEEATGDVGRTEAAFHAALEIGESEGQRILEAWALGGLGEMARRRGDLDEAAELLERGVRVANEIGAGSTDWLLGFMSARLAVTRGDQTDAREAIRTGAEFALRHRSGRSLAAIADIAGHFALSVGDAVAAARLFGASSHLYAEGHEKRAPHDQAELDDAMSSIRDELGDRVDALLAEGAALEFDAVVDAVLAV